MATIKETPPIINDCGEMRKASVSACNRVSLKQSHPSLLPAILLCLLTHLPEVKLRNVHIRCASLLNQAFLDTPNYQELRVLQYALPVLKAKTMCSFPFLSTVSTIRINISALNHL